MPVHEGIELKLHGHVYFQHTADFKCSIGQLSNLFFYYSALWTIHIKSVWVCMCSQNKEVHSYWCKSLVALQPIKGYHWPYRNHKECEREKLILFFLLFINLSDKDFICFAMHYRYHWIQISIFIWKSFRNSFKFAGGSKLQDMFGWPSQKLAGTGFQPFLYVELKMVQSFSYKVWPIQIIL